ncbi:MAG: CPBP family intramembrane metalloprotease [Pelosinus sp.]|nr:CPBP family intramembrane metalloprotease [Pelosinus sp.]
MDLWKKIDDLIIFNSLLKHIVFFYMVWACSEVVLFPFLRMKSAIFSDAFGPIWKIAVWLLPVIAILKAGQYQVFAYLKLDSDKRAAILWGVPGVIFIAAYNILMRALFYANMVFYPWLTFTQWLNTVFIAGVVEEILYRGYFLQKINECFSFWKANLLVSLLFVSIHFPIWYVNADKIAHNAVVWSQLISFVFCFSLLQGWLFKRSASLWPCIMAHMMNNFMALALVG